MEDSWASKIEKKKHACQNHANLVFEINGIFYYIFRYP